MAGNQPPTSGHASVHYPLFPQSQLTILMEMLSTNHEFLLTLHYALGGIWQGTVTNTRTSPTHAVQVRPLGASSTSASSGWIRLAVQGYTPTNGDVVLCQYLPGKTKAFVVAKIQ